VYHRVCGGRVASLLKGSQMATFTAGYAYVLSEVGENQYTLDNAFLI
jgi:hypothetical protein